MVYWPAWWSCWARSCPVRAPRWELASWEEHPSGWHPPSWSCWSPIPTQPWPTQHETEPHLEENDRLVKVYEHSFWIPFDVLLLWNPKFTYLTSLLCEVLHNRMTKFLDCNFQQMGLLKCMASLWTILIKHLHVCIKPVKKKAPFKLTNHKAFTKFPPMRTCFATCLEILTNESPGIWQSRNAGYLLISSLSWSRTSFSRHVLLRFSFVPTRSSFNLDSLCSHCSITRLLQKTRWFMHLHRCLSHENMSAMSDLSGAQWTYLLNLPSVPDFPRIYGTSGNVWKNYTSRSTSHSPYWQLLALLKWNND